MNQPLEDPAIPPQWIKLKKPLTVKRLVMRINNVSPVGTFEHNVTVTSEVYVEGST